MHSISRISLAVLATLLALPAGAASQVPAGVRLPPVASAPVAPSGGRLIIKLKSGVNVQVAPGVAGVSAWSADSRLSGVLSQLGISRLKPLFPGLALKAARSPAAAAQINRGLQRIHLVQLPERDAGKALDVLRRDPAVEYVEVDHAIRVSSVNDPYVGSLGSWGQSYADLWGHQRAGVPASWTRSSGAGVVVAVVDTGIDLNHEDLAANIAVNAGEINGNGVDDDGNGYIDDYYGWNFFDNNNQVGDGYGHGTHVAGTIAAVANNGKGLAGVAWGSRLLNVKIMGDGGSGLMSAAAEGLVYAADRGARVLNNSWGGPASQVVDDAIAYARGKGVVVVAAAGNEYRANVETTAPAGSPGTIVVSAADATDALAAFSNIGMKLDVAAPGVDVLSALAPSSVLGGYYPGQIVGGNYLRISGTSMAAPHVAGVAAQLLSMQPGLTPEQVRYWLRQGAEDVGAPGFDEEYGYGMLRADNTLNQAAAGTAPLVSGGFANTLRGSYIGGSVTLSGHANGAGFASYELAWQRLGSGAPFTTFHNSATPTAGDAPAALGTLNTAGLASGEYHLRLRVKGSNGGWLDYYDRAFTDPTMRAGWPRVLSTESLTGAASWEYEATLVDLDGDGSKEIIVPSLDTVHAFNANGSYRPGFPAYVGNVCEVTGSVTVADISGDSKPELVFPCWGEAGRPGVVAALDSSGRMLNGFPTGTISSPSMTVYSVTTRGNVVVSDMNGDGKKEIVVSGIATNGALTRGQVFATVINGQGQTLTGWPQLAPVFNVNTDVLLANGRPLVADIDRDGVEEVVVNDVTSSSGSGARLAVYRFNGTLLRSIDLSSQLAVAFNPLFADVNADGTPELVTVGCRTTGLQYATVVSGTGVTLSGWPRQVSNGIRGCDATRTPWTVVDLDQDKKLELVVGTDQGLNALNAQGVAVSGWPKVIGSEFRGANIGVAQFGPAAPALVFQLNERLWAVDRTGTVIPGWPKGMPISASVAPALGTLDASGKLAIVANTSVGDLTNYSAQLMVFDETLAAGSLPSGCVSYRCDARRSGAVPPVVVNYNKVYNQVYLRGTHNNWATNAPMQLVGHNTWEVTVTFGSTATERFKFDINGDWVTNFGDTNRDLIADAAGSDIQVTQGAGSYRVRFNDSTRVYSVTRVGASNQAPVANAGPDQNLTSSSPLAVLLNGSASTDSDGTIASYVWDENVNGSWVNVGTGASLTVNSVSVGPHRYRLTVTDNNGASSTDEVLVTITSGFAKVYNQVYVRGTSNNWGITSMTLINNNTWETTVTFGSTTSERFKFDINGDWATNFGDTNKDLIADPAGSDILVSQGAGSYKIRFNDSTRVYSVTRQSGGNAAPVANAGPDQTITSSSPVSVTLNGTASSDSDGSISSYVWDEYVNGAWVNVGSGATLTLSNVSVAAHRYRLTVTDNGGATHSDEVLVTISAGGFSKVYNQVYVRGTNNSWGTTSMTLVANNTWEVTVSFGSTTTERFKLDIYGNWTLNFGDNNADGIAEQTGGDIAVKGGAGSYRIRFNDSTRAYSVVKQ